ncbi:hypothetical protein BT96DRAFT_784627, partial [Gymnopus androsaceus JB14]
HYGSHDIPGSLAYFFALLDKKWLAGKKPDYHALSTALLQILEGALLAAWKKECGHPSLDIFAALNPQPTKLKEIAVQIIHKYCTPM